MQLPPTIRGAGMDFTFTEEQSLLRSSLAAYLADQYGFETRRQVVQTEPGWRPEVWRAFAQDLGILGALAPAELDGAFDQIAAYLFGGDR